MSTAKTTKTTGYTVTVTGIGTFAHSAKSAAMAHAREMKLETDSSEGLELDVHREWYNAALGSRGRDRLAAWCVIGGKWARVNP